MVTSESKGLFFLQNESIRIDSHNESNRFESRIGMLYYAHTHTAAAATTSATLLSVFTRAMLCKVTARVHPVNLINAN